MREGHNALGSIRPPLDPSHPGVYPDPMPRKSTTISNPALLRKCASAWRYALTKRVSLEFAASRYGVSPFSLFKYRKSASLPMFTGGRFPVIGPQIASATAHLSLRKAARFLKRSVGAVITARSRARSPRSIRDLVP